MKIGVDIGGSHYAIGLVNEEGKIIKKIEQDIKVNSNQSFTQIIQTQMIKHIKQIANNENVECIGISIPGTIENGIVLLAENLNVSNYPIKKEIEEQINLPIKIENDANCATIAEYTYGSMKPYKNALLITIGTGIGGGIIVNGSLFKSTHFPGMEIGHMVIKKDGKECTCGSQGCFETYASMHAFKSIVKEELNLPLNTTGKEILNFITQNSENQKVKQLVNDYINNLSIGIGNLINLFEPEIICIGGSFVHFETIFLPKLKEKLLNSDVLFNKRDSINIVCTKLGNDAGIIGSII